MTGCLRLRTQLIPLILPRPLHIPPSRPLALILIIHADASSSMMPVRHVVHPHSRARTACGIR